MQIINLLKNLKIVLRKSRFPKKYKLEHESQKGLTRDYMLKRAVMFAQWTSYLFSNAIGYKTFHVTQYLR